MAVIANYSVVNGILNTQAADASGTTATFLSRVAVAIASVANAVITEDQTYYNNSTNGQHYARLKLATLVLSNPLAYATLSFGYEVTADLVTNSSSTDDDILDRCLAIWNNMSAAYL